MIIVTDGLKHYKFELYNTDVKNQDNILVAMRVAVTYYLIGGATISYIEL